MSISLLQKMEEEADEYNSQQQREKAKNFNF
jgi:hypothetical protein